MVIVDKTIFPTSGKRYRKHKKSTTINSQRVAIWLVRL